VVYDKLPMFYRQIQDQKYLSDFAISFAGVGDITCDRNPIQVTTFEQGIALDETLTTLDLEGGGGRGELRESYEMLAFYYAHFVDFEPEPDEKPFLFFVCDEAPRRDISGFDLKKHFGGTHHDTTTHRVFQELTSRYRTFALCTPYREGGFPREDEEVRSEWRLFLPETTITVIEPRSIIDVMLGIIALRTGARSIEGYVEDMLNRGQTQERVDNIRKVLTCVGSWQLDMPLSVAEGWISSLLPTSTGYAPTIRCRSVQRTSIRALTNQILSDSFTVRARSW